MRRASRLAPATAAAGCRTPRPPANLDCNLSGVASLIHCGHRPPWTAEACCRRMATACCAMPSGCLLVDSKILELVAHEDIVVLEQFARGLARQANQVAQEQLGP